MTQTPPYLKLHVEDFPETQPPSPVEYPHWAALCRRLEEATGWRVWFEAEEAAPAASRRTSSPANRAEWNVPIASPGRPSPGRLAAAPAAAAESAAPPLAADLVRPLVEEVGNLLGEVHRLRYVLWQREAELAAAVPVAPRPDEPQHLAERLEAVLRGGVEAVGCQAAALYLLDDATSRLKLRSVWGLPQDRLCEAARPLEGAIADLEALLGHAVVIEDASLLPHWNIPERFPAAVCLPVSSPTVPLGTLWVYSSTPRDFTSEQTNLLEIVAGRIAADLEREVLLGEGVAARRFDQALAALSQRQRELLPHVAPLVDGYDVAAWTQQADEVGGDFHDWFLLPDGSLAVTVGDVHGQPLEAAFGAAALAAAIKAHSRYPHDPRKMLQRANHTLWTSAAGGQFASLLYATIAPATGTVRYAAAGEVGAMILRPYGHEAVGHQSEPLGAEPEARFPQYRQVLATGDVLLVVSAGLLRLRDRRGRKFDAGRLGEIAQRRRGRSAEAILAAVRKEIETSRDPLPDRTILVVQRQ